MPVDGILRNIDHLIHHPIFILVHYHFFLFLNWVPCCLLVVRARYLGHKTLIFLLLVSRWSSSLFARAQFSHHKDPLLLLFFSQRYSRIVSRSQCSRHGDLLLLLLCHNKIPLLLTAHNVCITKRSSCMLLDVQRVVDVFVSVAMFFSYIMFNA